MTYSIYIAESASSGNHVSNALAGGSYVLKWVTTSGPYGGGNFYYNSSLYNSAEVFFPSAGNTGTNTSGTTTIVAQNPANNADFATTAYTLRAGHTTGNVHATSPTTTVYRQATIPTSITFSNVGSTSMTVTASGGQYGTMQVRMVSPVTTAFTSSLPVTYTGLTPGTTHSFQARRENSVGTSGVRIGSQSTTGGASGTLSGSNAISLTSASYDTANTHIASFTWSASPSAIYYYTSTQMTPGSGSLNSSASTGGSFTLTAASNTVIGSYGFGYSTTVLRSGSTGGTNLDSHITYIYQRPAAPSISISNITDTSFDATYTSNESGFGALLTNRFVNSGTYDDQGASTTFTKTYSGLSPGTNYTVRAKERNNVAESDVVTASATTTAAADVIPDDINWADESGTSRVYSITNASTSTYYQAYWFTTGVTANTDIYWHLETSSTAHLGYYVGGTLTWITNDTKMTRQLNQAGYVRIFSSGDDGTWRGAKIIATTGNDSIKSGTTAALGYFNVTTANTSGDGTSTGGSGTATYGLEVRNSSGNVILGSSNRHGGLIASGAVTNQSGGNTLAANATSASITVEGLTANNSSTIEILLAGATGYGTAYALSVSRGNGSFTVQNLTSSDQDLTYYAVRY